MSSLRVPFDLRGTSGAVEVEIDVNDDPGDLGCGLLTERVRAESAVGFPVCTASIRYDRRGYAAALGWIQLVRSTDGASNGAVFELDPLALLRDVPVPYAFFGIKPTLFDAPFRVTRTDLDWRAQSFVCFAPDAVMTKQVHAVAGFSWGFWLRRGEMRFQEPEALGPADWNDHLATLASAYPGWTFRPGFRSQ
jgi:hypothetical protein